MDPATVIVVLAAHLLCSGGLLFLIARRMPPRSGISLWATGLMLFGAAYMGRLLAGLDAAGAWLVLLDTAMVGAALLFVAGLLDFTGRTALASGTSLAMLAAFVAVDLAAVANFEAQGRHVVLNASLGALYAWLAASALRARREVEPPLRLSLAVMCGLMGVLAALTLLRALLIASAGATPAYAGLLATVYYGYASLAAVLLAMSLLWMVFERLNGQLAELASRDALTRALNRKGLQDAMTRHFGSRNATPRVLLAIDVDHFKRINDTQGHATGDLVLRAIAATLARQVRGGDWVARVGGEEFLVCCPAAEPDTLMALAERLREAVAALSTVAAHGRSTVRCTVSIGISRPFGTLVDWPRAATEADAALYAAKSGGRNRVVAD